MKTLTMFGLELTYFPSNKCLTLNCPYLESFNTIVLSNVSFLTTQAGYYKLPNVSIHVNGASLCTVELPSHQDYTEDLAKLNNFLTDIMLHANKPPLSHTMEH